ncbi:hypothetical protein BHM03_00026493 [Ensete ventricosum]|nr:hypothetical protein BHM03_00026493 [Ensete ventricosum]
MWHGFMVSGSIDQSNGFLPGWNTDCKGTCADVHLISDLRLSFTLTGKWSSIDHSACANNAFSIYAAESEWLVL